MCISSRYLLHSLVPAILTFLLVPSSAGAEPITVFGAVHLSISVEGQNYTSNTPIVLDGDRHDDWIMLSNGAIVLADHRTPSGGYLGLTILDQLVSDDRPIILHAGYNTWRFADDGTIRVTDPKRKKDPDSPFGLKVKSLKDGEPLVLHHEELNIWVRGRSAQVLDHMQRRFKRERQILGDREHSIVMMYEDDNGWRDGGDKWRVSVGKYSNKGRGGYPDLPVENDEVRSLIIPADYRVYLTDDDNFRKGSHGKLTLYGPRRVNIKDTDSKKLAGKVSSIDVSYVEPVAPRRTRPAFSVKCADEGGQCKFSGTQVVWYGAGRSYVSKMHTDGTKCITESFDRDPYPYTHKACYLEQLQLPYGAIKCATAGGTDGRNECRVLNPFGRTTVYYGSTVAGNDMYFAREFGQEELERDPRGTFQLTCVEDKFAGNPVEFYGKNCYLAPKPRPQDAKKCADEGENCEWTETATGTVWYGAENSYAARTFQNRQSIPCKNEIFGDPLIGTRKACYIKYN